MSLHDRIAEVLARQLIEQMNRDDETVQQPHQWQDKQWVTVGEYGDYGEHSSGEIDIEITGLADAVVKALNLRQEWQIETDGAIFGRHLTYEDAEKERAERWAIEGIVPHPTDWDRNPRITTRYVTDWTTA